MGDPAAGSKGSVRLEVADAIATITLDRPNALNALTVRMKQELLRALRRIGRDREVRSVVLTGAGRAFCAGQDLNERLEPDAAPLAVEVRERYNPIIRPERLRPSPVQGELVAAGDLGRKTGRGFYRYDESGQAIGPVGARPPAAGTKGADAAAIVGRIRAAIEAEAALAVADGVASAADIALALRLGAGHPTTLTDGLASGDQPARA